MGNLPVKNWTRGAFPSAYKISGKTMIETIAAFGSLCMNDNLESIAKANDICNRPGIDTISTWGA